jgi:formate transporter
MNKEVGFDALLPPQVAEKAVEVGVKKAQSDVLSTLGLSVLAGAFIAVGAVFATSITAGAKDVLPFGVVKLLTGLAFTLGLILVIVGGAELFTGNNLIMIAFANGRISLARLLRTWVLVYIGNWYL